MSEIPHVAWSDVRQGRQSEETSLNSVLYPSFIPSKQVSNLRPYVADRDLLIRNEGKSQ